MHRLARALAFSVSLAVTTRTAAATCSPSCTAPQTCIRTDVCGYVLLADPDLVPLMNAAALKAGSPLLFVPGSSAAAEGALSAAPTAATCTPATCSGPTQHLGIDPLPQPPGGKNLWPMDSGARPAILRDQDPTGLGDLFGLFYAGDAAGAAGASWYLLVSADGGASFSYLPPTGAAGPLGTRPAIYWGLAQDTATYRIHQAWWPYGSTGGLYARAALTRSGGHIVGWSWEAVDVPLPALDASGDGFSLAAKLDLKEVVDGTGARALALVAQHQPAGAGCLQRLVAARTAPGARALSPTSASDWVRLTDGAPGWDVVASYAGGAAPCGTGAWTALTSESRWLQHHTADFTWAQLPADGSLHLFDGEMYYVDAWVDVPGEVRRWRLARQTGTPYWAPDPNASGAVVARSTAYSRATLGNAAATQNFVWLAYGSSSGMHVDRVGSSGAWFADAIPQPDTKPNGWWWTALAVNPDEQRVYAYWEVSDYGTGASPPWSERSGYFDGAAWTVTDETLAFRRYPPFNGVTSWLPILIPDGVGVFAYGYQDWNTARQHFHVHLLR
jgi:hypothetical protein